MSASTHQRPEPARTPRCEQFVGTLAARVEPSRPPQPNRNAPRCDCQCRPAVAARRADIPPTRAQLPTSGRLGPPHHGVLPSRSDQIPSPASRSARSAGARTRRGPGLRAIEPAAVVACMDCSGATFPTFCIAPMQDQRVTVRIANTGEVAAPSPCVGDNSTPLASAGPGSAATTWRPARRNRPHWERTEDPPVLVPRS